MEVKAFDRDGNEFIKEVSTRTAQGEYSRGLVICFGGPVEYYAEDLVKHYPYKRPMCIDMMGLNHKSIPHVCIPEETMDEILEKLAPSYLRQENCDNFGCGSIGLCSECREVLRKKK